MFVLWWFAKLDSKHTIAPVSVERKKPISFIRHIFNWKLTLQLLGKLVVMRSSTHLEPQAAILANGRLFRHGVELNVFNRVSQSATSTITDGRSTWFDVTNELEIRNEHRAGYRRCTLQIITDPLTGDLDNGDLADKVLRITSVLPVLVLDERALRRKMWLKRRTRTTLWTTLDLQETPPSHRKQGKSRKSELRFLS